MTSPEQGKRQILAVLAPVLLVVVVAVVSPKRLEDQILGILAVILWAAVAVKYRRRIIPGLRRRMGLGTKQDRLYWGPGAGRAARRRTRPSCGYRRSSLSYTSGPFFPASRWSARPGPAVHNGGAQDPGSDEIGGGGPGERPPRQSFGTAPTRQGGRNHVGTAGNQRVHA